jgi:hypothetical protein
VTREPSTGEARANAARKSSTFQVEISVLEYAGVLETEADRGGASSRDSRDVKEEVALMDGEGLHDMSTSSKVK